jgi:hypothetical protein
MAETTTDPRDPSCRHTAFPALAVNRLGAAGLLLMAIHELPAPAEDLLNQGEGLANFIRKQQRSDGSFRLLDDADEFPKENEVSQTYPGFALYGLMLSQRNRPAAWKTEVARKALPFYHAWWNANANFAAAPMFSAAFAEAYLLTKEMGFATCVFAINDWVCSLQYTKDDARNPNWVGGFKSIADGKAVNALPTLQSAAQLEGLVQACRVTRQVPDATRYDRYKDVAAQTCQFLTGLQFNEDSTRHFASHHRSLLIGGFHMSAQDGNLRIDSHAPAVAGMIQYLAHAADR